jgi:hypothetical protein
MFDSLWFMNSATIYIYTCIPSLGSIGKGAGTTHHIENLTVQYLFVSDIMASTSAKLHDQKLKTPGVGAGEPVHPWAVTVEAPQDVSRRLSREAYSS